MNKDAFKNQAHYTHADLQELVEVLRRECPWDKAQTHQSIRRGVIEEAYEVAEAIDRADAAMMAEELGDLLLQVLFHISIGEEKGTFDATAVYDRICQKLIFRHPHIFGDAKDAASSTEEGWAAIKRLEKGQQTLAEEVNGIAKTLPALTRAEKIAGKCHKEDQPELLTKALRSRVAELAAPPDEKQLGELLFLLARLAKSAKIDPEEALHRKNQDVSTKICDNS